MPLDELIFSRAVLEMRESDAFKEAMRRIEARLFADWQKTSPLDRESREAAWAQGYAARLLMREFDTMAMPARTERNAKLREQGESTALRRPKSSTA